MSEFEEMAGQPQRLSRSRGPRGKSKMLAITLRTVMKLTTIKLLAIVAASHLFCTTWLFAQSTLNISLRDDNGLTRVSILWSGGITSTGTPAPYSYWIGVGGSYRNAMGGFGGTTNTVDGLGTFVGYVTPLDGFGSFRNLDTGSSATINQFIAIPNYSGTGSLVAIRFGHELQNTTNHIIQYIPSVDSATVSVPFAAFNPGTYQVWPEQPIQMTLTVVPEPSAITLAGLAGLAFLFFRRR